MKESLIISILVVVIAGIVFFLLYTIPVVNLDEGNREEIRYWSKSDLISMSATIIGFFGLGSFVSIKLIPKNINHGKAVMLLLITIGVIIIMHLFGVFYIISGYNIIEIYRLLILLTVIAIIAVVGLTMKIILEQSPKSDKDN